VTTLSLASLIARTEGFETTLRTSDELVTQLASLIARTEGFETPVGATPRSLRALSRASSPAPRALKLVGREAGKFPVPSKGLASLIARTEGFETPTPYSAASRAAISRASSPAPRALKPALLLPEGVHALPREPHRPHRGL